MTEQTVIQINTEDLPLRCPNDAADIAMLHPQVCIPLTAGKPSTCPYCGTIYQLEAQT